MMNEADACNDDVTINSNARRDRSHEFLAEEERSSLVVGASRSGWHEWNEVCGAITINSQFT